MSYGITISTTKYKTASGGGGGYSISDETADGYGVVETENPWILAKGYWNDDGRWVDGAKWKDL